jgi:NADH dehydrogenase FAD-containing subunit
LSASTLINFQTSAYAKEERPSLASKKAKVIIIGGGYGGVLQIPPRSFLPKFGFGANMQGKAVANIINKRLTGKKCK